MTKRGIIGSKSRRRAHDPDVGKLGLGFAREIVEDARAQHLGRLVRLQNLHERDARSVDHAVPAACFA